MQVVQLTKFETVNQNSAADCLLSISRKAMPVMDDRDDLVCSNSLWWGLVLITLIRTRRNHMSLAKAVIVDVMIEFLYLDTALQCLEIVDKMRMRSYS